MPAAPTLLATLHLDLLRQLDALWLDLEHLRADGIVVAVTAIGTTFRIYDVTVALVMRSSVDRVHLALSVKLALLVRVLALPLGRNLRAIELLHLLLLVLLMLLVLHASHVVELQLALLEAALGFVLSQIPAFLFIAGELARLRARSESPFVRLTVAVFDEVEAFASRFIPVSRAAFFDVDFANELGDGNAHCGSRWGLGRVVRYIFDTMRYGSVDDSALGTIKLEEKGLKKERGTKAYEGRKSGCPETLGFVNPFGILCIKHKRLTLTQRRLHQKQKVEVEVESLSRVLGCQSPMLDKVRIEADGTRRRLYP